MYPAQQTPLYRVFVGTALGGQNESSELLIRHRHSNKGKGSPKAAAPEKIHLTNNDP